MAFGQAPDKGILPLLSTIPRRTGDQHDAYRIAAWRCRFFEIPALFSGPGPIVKCHALQSASEGC
jgi:hypothetical protein